MTTIIEEKIRALHASSAKIVLVCTGAGAGCQNLISQVPGASATLLECTFPYSQEALTDFLGFSPTQYVSEDTALRMAARAWRRGIELAIRQHTSPDNVLGVAVTAVIGTNRPLRGDHRAHIAVRNKSGFFSGHIVFAKGPDGLSLIGRMQEGELCDLLTLNALLTVLGIGSVSLPNTAFTVRQWEVKEFPIPHMEDLVPDRHILFPGSFNPLHFGHEHMARAAAARTGKEIVYVINTTHPDKGQLSDEEIKRRTDQFAWLAPIHVTHGLDLFVEKAREFPGFTFLIGADTLERMLDVRYSLSTAQVLLHLSRYQSQFLVVDRCHDGRPVTLAEIRKNIPVQHQGMFESLPLMINVSSTQVRCSFA